MSTMHRIPNSYTYECPYKMGGIETASIRIIRKEKSTDSSRSKFFSSAAEEDPKMVADEPPLRNTILNSQSIYGRNGELNL